MSRLKLIAAVVTVCTGCGEFSGTPREERARVVELTQAVLAVTPELHELGLSLTQVGDLDGNGVGDVALGGDLVPFSLKAPARPELPHWLLLLSDDPDAPIKSVRVIEKAAEGRGAHFELRDAGRVTFRSFEATATPELGQLVGVDAQGRLLFVHINERGELLNVVAQQVVCEHPELRLENWRLLSPAVIPDRNGNGIPEVIDEIPFTSETGERIRHWSLVLPGSDSDAAVVTVLELPDGFHNYEIDALQPVAHDAATGRLRFLAVIVPKLPADPNYGATGPRSLVAFELELDGTLSEPVTIAEDLGALMGGGDDVFASFQFLETSLAALEGGGRLHLIPDWWPLGPSRFPPGLYGGLFPDPGPREYGHRLLGLDWDEESATARDPSTLAFIDWRAPDSFLNAVAIEARDAEGVTRRTRRVLASGLPGHPKGEPGVLAEICFESAP
ncbi:MAG: hypothetical protein DHS20C15_03170 [Planctomycetota bacterium]|nr:MAG: hypothetical protein DHS20C15_03170 [Planctomycetota bacterium]